MTETAKHISYGNVKSFWDDEYRDPAFHYGQGWHMANEDFGRLRFRWEIKQYAKLFSVHERGADTLLDIGCGNGKHSFYFAKHFKHVTGVDLSPNGIRIAKNRAAQLGSKNTIFLCKDVARADLGQKFDVIFDGAVIPYLNKPDLVPFFKNVRRHLKSGGRVLFRAPLFRSKQTLVRTGDYHIIYWPLQKILNDIAAGGLRVLDVRINHAYQYGILMDFFKKILRKLFRNESAVQRIAYGFLGKRWFMAPCSRILGPLVRVRGHFIIATPKEDHHAGD